MKNQLEFPPEILNPPQPGGKAHVIGKAHAAAKKQMGPKKKDPSQSE